MKFIILSLLIPAFANANPVHVVPECAIKNDQGLSIHTANSLGPEKLVLGFDGNDGGQYKIQVTNNGGTRWEKSHGAILLGLSRDDRGVQNPPRLCPRGDEGCVRRNEGRHTRAPTDRFISLPNLDGEVDAESRTGNPDDLGLTQFVIFADEVTADGNVWETERFRMGGVEVSCTIKAKRLPVSLKVHAEDPVCPNGGPDCEEEPQDGKWE